MSEFLEILGNKRNIEHLSEAAETGKLSHAYIINGGSGSGKKTFAEFIAASLLCSELGRESGGGQQDLFSMMSGAPLKVRTLKDGPCGECPACVKTRSGNHPDIIHVTHEKPNVIKVDEIRDQLISDITVKPYYGPYKIYIVDDAQYMNVNAQNALLKTIEEPPAYGIIFLLSDNADAFLDTIKSRCIRLDMDSLSDELVKEYLKKNLGAGEEDAAAAAAFANGNLGTAMEICRHERLYELKAQAEDIILKLSKMDAAEIYSKAESVKKGDAADLLEVIRKWYRDLLVYKSCEGRDCRLYFKNREADIRKAAAKVSYNEIDNSINAIEKAIERIKVNVKSDAVLESLFLTLRRNSR